MVTFNEAMHGQLSCSLSDCASKIAESAFYATYVAAGPATNHNFAIEPVRSSAIHCMGARFSSNLPFLLIHPVLGSLRVCAFPKLFQLKYHSTSRVTITPAECPDYKNCLYFSG